MSNIRIISTLLIGFLIIVSAMLWQFSRLQSGLIESTALKTAGLYSVALSQFRTLYTSEVITKASNAGLKVTHDYSKRTNSIPLPATLSMKLGEEIGKSTSGAKANLYSPYPFPWRKKENKLQQTSFNREAFAFLARNPTQTFSRFEQIGNQTTLYYATADIMQVDCVACHNSHLDSPKTNWKVGDVRGVLSISLPLNSIIAQTETDLRSTALLYFSFGLVIVAIIGFVIVNLRQRSQKLETSVAERTAELETEIFERRKAMQTLTDIEFQNRLLLDSAGEGIYGLDLKGETTFVNPAACKMLGYEAKELLGQPIHALVHHSYPDGSLYPREKCPMYSAFTEGKLQRVENEVLWRKDGSSSPVDYTSTPLKKEGALIGAVVIFKDVSERKKIERMKKEFVSTVSHELRTPLTSIKGSLGLIVSGKLGKLPAQVEKLLNLANENSERLAFLINDLLDIDKIQSGETNLQMKPVNVNSFIENSLASNQGYADKYAIHLQWQPGLENNFYVLGDQNRLNQVLSNLLSNAVKYSPKGGEVTVSTQLIDDKIRVSVTDHGPGIPLDFQHRLFEKFTQADSSDTRKVGGTGLGLAISKELIEKHGGLIGFDSKPEQQTTFFFELPILKSGEQ